MRNVFKNPKGLILAGLSVIVITAAAWQTDDKDKKNDSTRRQSTGDTIVPKQRNNDKNEFRMKQLDEAMKELDLHLKDLDIEISKNVKEALAQVDFEKISKDVQAQLKQVDFDKINKEVQEELKKVDFNKINIEVQQSLKEAQEEIKKVDMQKLQNEMKEMQLKLNSTQFKQQIENAMQGAKKEIEKAKQELQDLKDFTNALEKDGLIDKKKGYTVEWTKDGDLIINGKTQPKDIADKYSRYYKKDGYKIKIRPDDDHLEIDDL
ncbi:hypothetical protein FRZ67_08970 [Panacibacter ginsenosidivorans]|uniref:OmpH family outer membrane protein n=1 Tax=Panacibacter ginsenosidivorans TaxID=1813871 RepID=A0A5B8V992_9BACT|nr:hypothetical protein [Panacibacter ginsenosidivorans]QEC67421.1 hypothetical protein FRZ67_08970 [Panacibacter ginsenosidivorans]